MNNKLPRDRCQGESNGITCDVRESCLRYLTVEGLSQYYDEKENLTWLLPELKLRESGCREYIGEN